jgi:pimeloyl-ACP methyl ester carboxylesterase
MGLRRNIQWWYRQIPVIGRHYRLIVFDNRGAGRSGKPEMEYSIRMFADDTAALMDQLAIERASILGFSMGGYIAQELAINYPHKVQSLVLAATSAGGASAVRMDPERQKEFTDVAGLTSEHLI